MLEQPRTESCARLCCGSSLLCERARVALGLLRLDGLEEINVERVTLVDIGNVGSEAVGGILVCEQAGVLELPSEDLFTLVSESMSRGKRRTVDEEDDSLGLVGFLGLGNVGLETSDGLDVTLWCAFLDLASQAAR
jgi:hypothetical protein